MQKFWSLLLWLTISTAHAQVHLIGLEPRYVKNQLEVRLTLSGNPDYKVETRTGPDRVVVDLKDTVWRAGEKPPRYFGELKRIGHMAYDAQNLRLEFQGKKLPLPTMSKELLANGNIVLVLHWHHAYVPPPPVALKPAMVTSSKQATAKPSLKVPMQKFVVAIDPGHGGIDPGAIGKHGTKEKHVVMAIAKAVKRNLDQIPGIKTVLIRKGDEFVSLRKRLALAKAQKADLFISIHADAGRNPNASGASVFILSNRGAKSARERLKENHGLIPNIHIAQARNLEHSKIAADSVLKELQKVTSLHRKRVARAGFLVLKSHDMPSLLIETGFISHKTAEKHLSTAQHQEKLGKAIANGVAKYARDKQKYHIKIGANTVTQK